MLLLKVSLIRLDIRGKGKEFLHERYKKYMEKVVVRISLFQSSVPFYRNCPFDVLIKSVDWFLYNGNVGLNGKVDP